MSADDLSELEAGDCEASQAAEALENLQRRMADLEVRNELALAGFEGRNWDRYAEELARYGRAVIMAWLATGEIFRQCKKKGCFPGPAPQRWDEDDWEGLANEVVGAAVVAFRDQALVAGKWSYNGGATLKTYFIGACVYQFPNAFRRWRTDDETWRQLRRLEPGSDELINLIHSRNTEDLAVTRLASHDAFEAIPDDRTKRAMLLQSVGYSYPEIAELMETTPKTVDNLLIRHRKRVAQPRAASPARPTRRAP